MSIALLVCGIDWLIAFFKGYGDERPYGISLIKHPRFLQRTQLLFISLGCLLFGIIILLYTVI